jgi:murein L,D-transpeptidase YafK
MMLKPILLLLTVSLLFTSFISPPDFIAEQKKYERVREAFVDKEALIKAQLKKNGLQADDFHLLITAFKDDDVLNVFARKKTEKVYQQLITYKVCARSGRLGPKRKSGDLQVPEGFYQINRFNPTSNFYLSLGINYPNASDQIKNTAPDKGGDIFIHGSCVTIGCLPMTDDKIKEIYLYAIHARNNGQQKIPVYIFPFRMTDQNMKKYSNQYADEKALLQFWKNLKVGYDRFEKDHKELTFSISEFGEYQF